MVNILKPKTKQKKMASRKINISELTPYTKIRIHEQGERTYQETQEIIYRLYIQTLRKPTTLIISIIQPLLWLIMFGALFQNAPIYLFENYNIEYQDFLNSGIIIFTAFNSAVNAGLTIIFDREFGFLNKILISPIANKNSIMYACITHTWTITMIQVLGIASIKYYDYKIYRSINLIHLLISLIVISTIITTVSNVSIYGAFILPGHIEFIGLTSLFLNLPTLFTSTALAPLSFMPRWLQFLCCINPLTYGIEIIRSINLDSSFAMKKQIINTSLMPINGYSALTILLIINTASFFLVKTIIQYKYDKN